MRGLRRGSGWRWFWIARRAGATVIRSQPLAPEIEEMADRDGILIWSDIPVNQYVGNKYLNQPAWLARAQLAA